MYVACCSFLLQEEYFRQLELSSTLYIGNLSFYTTEDQVCLCHKLGATCIVNDPVLTLW